jgi:hypothetical protein
MTPSNEEIVIRQKLKELSGLVEQRDQVQARIAKTEAAISAFIELLENELDQQLYTMMLKKASKPVGLTESIKRVFREARGATLSPSDARERLEEDGFPLSGYANPLAVIYTTFTRLRDQGLIEETDEKEAGIFKWKWIAKEPSGWMESMMADMANQPNSTNTGTKMAPRTRRRIGRVFLALTEEEKKKMHEAAFEAALKPKQKDAKRNQ